MKRMTFRKFLTTTSLGAALALAAPMALAGAGSQSGSSTQSEPTMTLDELDAQRAEMAKTVEKWGHQIADWTERKAEKASDAADKTADVAAENLQIAWANVKTAWSGVEHASAEGYDKAKKRFNSAMRTLERSWDNLGEGS